MSDSLITLEEGFLIDNDSEKKQTVDSVLGKQGKFFLFGIISILSGSICLDHAHKYNQLFIAGTVGMVLGAVLLVIGCCCPDKPVKSEINAENHLSA